MCNRDDAARTRHAAASAKADPYEFAMYCDV